MDSGLENHGQVWLSTQNHSNSAGIRDGMQARVQNDGEFSEPFEVTNGVKQRCVMAPTLFSMKFSAMLTDAFQDSNTDFPINQVPF